MKKRITISRKTAGKIITSVIDFAKHVLDLIKQAVDKRVQKRRTKDSYQDLAPIDNISNGKEYLSALHWAINNKRIKNIALTGPYGSGKSSIINTYLKRHPIIRAKHLRVSMATFVEGAAGPSFLPQKIKVDSKQIEEGILKQLFYKVHHNKIPQSRYHKLYKIRFGVVWASIFLLVLAIAFFVYIFAPDSINNVASLVTDAGARVGVSTVTSHIIFFSVLLFITVVLSVLCYQLYTRIRLNIEVKVKNATITTGARDSESIFDKNMDEIIYFFEVTKYRIVFFEDLDRLDSAKIFVQLRELNTLLNNCDTIRQPVTFVYAVKDDIFTQEDRTKFFEFIIPVIPIINSSNSGETLLKLFQENGSEFFKHDITQDYIFDISPYISDMRILQNIHNEFLLYKRTLRTGQGLALSDKMMLSFIILKNLYPKDFADLQAGKGIIKKAFDDKDRYIQERQKTLENDIYNRSKQIEQATKDTLQSTRELKVSMLCALVNWKGIVIDIGERYTTEFTQEKIMEDSFDLSKLVQAKKEYYIRYRSWDGNTPNKDKVPGFVDICRSYYNRYMSLDAIEKTKIELIQEEIENKKYEKIQLSSVTVQQLLERAKEGLFLSPEVRANKLLVFMLRNGYIDENYVNYITYFKGNSITTKDMNYILAVKNFEPEPFDYEITKVDQVVQRLLPYEFKHRSVLNFDVLDYLLTSTAYKDKLDAMMEQFMYFSDTNWKFIDEFVRRTSNLPRFIQLLSQNWTKMWEHIYHDPVLTYRRKTFYLSLLCTYTEIETLVTFNGNDQLVSRFFVEHSDILKRLSCVDTDKLIAIISALKISFEKINIKGVDNKLLDYVFDTNSYNLNSEMIRSIVAYKDESLCGRLNRRNYSTIVKLGYKPLIDYVHDNLTFYIDSVILKGRNRNENIYQIIELIKRSVDDVELCKRIIDFEEFSLSDMSIFCSDLDPQYHSELAEIWNELLTCKRVEPTWNNVEHYWSLFGLSDVLIRFIEERVDTIISKKSIFINEALQEEIIHADVSADTFQKLIQEFGAASFDIRLDIIRKENVIIMIDHRFFPFNDNYYSELSEHHPSLCLKFIFKNKTEFLSCMSSIAINEALLEKLVIGSHADTGFVEKVIAHYGATLMTKNTAGQIVTHSIPVTREVFTAVWEMLDHSQRKAFLFMHFSILKAEDFETCFADLGGHYAKLADRSKRHKEMLPDTEENRKLTKHLIKADYLTSTDAGVIKVSVPGQETMAEQPAIACWVKAAPRVPSKKG